MLSFKEWTKLEERAIHLDHSLGIPRNEMPQIRGIYIADYLNWLQKEHHISHHSESVPAKTLKPLQSAIESDRVDQMKPGQSKEKPMIISKDSYILDGHHRWYQAMMSDEKLNVIRVGVAMRDLLKITKNYANVSYKEL